MLLIDRG